MARPWVWLQLVIGWLPIWALFVTLILSAHDDVTGLGAAVISFRMVLAGVVLGPLVARVARRIPWPHPMRASFVATHLAAAGTYASAWFAVNSLIESVAQGQAVLVIGPALGAYLIMGVWLYVMQAGVLYAATATTRAVNAELAATRSQLAALRGQLNPHFLFNALNTVAQLAPRAPERASEAAVSLAGLLRTSIEEDRDLVPFGDEWRFVERYLAMERMRFGNRLVVHASIDETAMTWPVPSFALQTLVENAVRHGAAPRVESTTLNVTARVAGEVLEVEVRDDGNGATVASLSNGGTGLRRLRERLTVLYGPNATLTVDPLPARGVSARLRVPEDPAS